MALLADILPATTRADGNKRFTEKHRIYKST